MKESVMTFISLIKMNGLIPAAGALIGRGSDETHVSQIQNITPGGCLGS